MIFVFGSRARRCLQAAVGCMVGLFALVSVDAATAQQAFDAGDLPEADRAAIQELLESERTDTRRRLPESGASFVIVRTETRPRICRWFVVEVPGEAARNGVGCRIGSQIWDIAGTSDAVPAPAPSAPSPATTDGPVVAEGPAPSRQAALIGGEPTRAAEPAPAPASTSAGNGPPSWTRSPPRPPGRPEAAATEVAALPAEAVPPALADWPQPPRRPDAASPTQAQAAPAASTALPSTSAEAAPTAPAFAEERPIPDALAGWPLPPPRPERAVSTTGTQTEEPPPDPVGGDTTIVFTDPPPPLPEPSDGDVPAGDEADVALQPVDPRSRPAENLLTGDPVPPEAAAEAGGVPARPTPTAGPVPPALADWPQPPRRPAVAEVPEAGVGAGASAPLDPPPPPRAPSPPTRG